MKMNEKAQKDLAEIDKEIKALNEYLSENSIGGLEYDAVVERVENAIRKLDRKNNFLPIKKISLIAALLILFFVALIQVSWFQKVVSVIGRLILLQLLPWWDWSRIYYSDCILTNPFYVRRAADQDDCKLCGSLKTIERLRDISPKMVWNSYLVNDRPFIVVDAMFDWKVMNTEHFWFDNITEIYTSEEQQGLEPCEFTTNLRTAPNDLPEFLHTIHNKDIWNWFGHWENCAKKSAKVLRPFYQRPYFIPSMVDLSESNWVLMSSNYFSKSYKQVDFSTELFLVAQVRGWNRIKLTPREPCNYYCPRLVDTIKEGQIVALTNFMWEFEYLPGDGTDNLAIGIGGDWD